MGSDYWFSLTDMKAPTSETGWNGSPPQSREAHGRRSKPHKRKQGGRSRFTVRPPCLSLPSVVLLSLDFPPLIPFGKLPLALLALVKSKDVRHDAAGNRFDLVLWNVGVIDELFSSTQVLSSV